jgi:hypothetical protein
VPQMERPGRAVPGKNALLRHGGPSSLFLRLCG